MHRQEFSNFSVYMNSCHDQVATRTTTEITLLLLNPIFV